MVPLPHATVRRMGRFDRWIRRGPTAHDPVVPVDPGSQGDVRTDHAPPALAFTSSESYWIERYRVGGDSGAGSYGHLAEHKAAVINSFVQQNDIADVIEFGCGDGNQLRLADYPRYWGFDVSAVAVDKCREMFADDETKTFALAAEYAGERADLSMSLDVVYHLVEDDVYDTYMGTLFNSAKRWVLVYSSNYDAKESPHVRHRRFTDWVELNKSDWILAQHLPNKYPYISDYLAESHSQFYFFNHRS